MKKKYMKKIVPHQPHAIDNKGDILHVLSKIVWKFEKEHASHCNLQ
jgi:hypothetical protein